MKRLLVLLLAACAGERSRPPAPAAPTPQGPSVDPAAAASTTPAAPATPELEPPRLRLPDTIRPVLYKPALTIVPSEDTFAGSIEIDLDVQVSSRVVWLNAQDLTVTRAEARAAGESLAGRVLQHPKDFVGIAFEEPLPTGPAALRLEYQGKVSRRDSAGVFRSEERGAWYASTHFEPIDARRAYPCFDEPSYKVPWQLTLRVKTGQRAFSNTAVESEQDGPDGFTTVRFARTRPLPSYLTAFAVGPWQRIDAGKAGKNGTAVGVVVPQGMGAQARWAAQVTPRIVPPLEDYFGIPYPFEKLDVIAVPLARGAMENVGLVTYGSTILLVRPEAETPSFRRKQAGTTAHELAHMWFGDLVTTAWWDDIWLNEAFATWMTEKVIEAWQPGWGAPLQRVTSRGVAMTADGLLSARRIRQPIESNDDMVNAFDAITYQKGGAVIYMYEQFLGPEKFRRGVQRYLKEHAYGNATASELLAAVSTEAGADIQSAFSTFLDQPGAPAVTAQLRCEGGKARLELSQERYFPLGAEPTAEQRAQIWQIPVCARWGDDRRACTLLAGKTGVLELPAKGCPETVVANAGAAGYYHLAAGGEKLLADGGKRLTGPERLATLQDLVALARAGRLDYGEILRLVPRLAHDPERQIVEATIAAVGGLRESQLVTDAELPQYQRWIREVYGTRARTLGWSPRAGESEEAKLLRPSLLKVMGDAGDDPATVGEARRRAEAWLADHRSVEPEVAAVALDAAAQHGDQAFFDRLHGAAKAERDRRDRQVLLAAMGSFRDPAIARQALAVAISDEFPARESISILLGTTRSLATRPVAYEFVQQNFDALAGRLPRRESAVLVTAGSALCDEQKRAAVEAFFKERMQRVLGGARKYAQAMETMRTCAAFRRAQAPAVARFFSEARASR